MQVELTGAKNRTDTNRKKDFEGTLAQRRRMYDDRRKAQGTEGTVAKVIREMQKEEKLQNGDAQAVGDGKGHGTVCACVGKIE